MKLLYETAMCAYAMLEGPNVNSKLASLSKEMKAKRIEPTTLHRTLFAFDMNYNAMIKLITEMKYHWPSIQLDTRFQEPYYLFCMMDMAKRGEFKIEANSTSDQQRIQFMKDKMREALVKCSLAFNTLQSSIFDKWVKVMAYHGDVNGVRASIILALEEQNKMLNPVDDALSWYWSSLIFALAKANKLDEAVAVLDEIKAKKCKTTITQYKQLMSLCGEVSDINERSRRVFGVYELMLKDGFVPDLDVFETMLSVLGESPSDVKKVKNLAATYQINLTRC